MNRSHVIKIIVSLILGSSWMRSPQVLYADCMGCPPTATKVTIELKNHQSVTGYIQVHYPYTERVIDEQQFIADYFPYDAGEQGYALLHEQGTDVFPDIEADNFVFQPRLGAYCEGTIEFTERSRVVTERPSLITLIGQPKRILISQIAAIKRLSRSYGTVFEITEEEGEYWTQHQPQSAAILRCNELETCYAFSFQHTVVSSVLVNLCNPCNTEKGEKEREEGIILLWEIGSN